MERRGNPGLNTTTTETISDAATREFVVRIAAEVIARLRANQAPTITSKVIDTRALETIASGTTVTIDPKAVVTPAARDEAKQKNITLHRSRLASGEAVPTNEIELEDHNPDRLAAAKSQLSRRGIRYIGTRVVMSDTPAAEVASQFKRGRVAVMVGSIADVSRFANEIVADVWVVDMKRNHLIASVNLIAAIARTTQTRPSSQVTK